MKSRTTHRRLLFPLLLVLALVLAACGNSDDSSEAEGESGGGSEPSGASTSVDAPGVTDDEIRFAAFGTNSNNPLGTCVLDCYVDGIRAYFEYRNSEGGVHGRKLVLEDGDVLDDELGKNKERAIQIVSDNKTFAAFSATQIASGWGDIAQAGMPLYTWSIHPAEARHDEIFGYAANNCIGCPSRVTTFLVQQAKAKKVAGLGYGVSENSKICSQAVKTSLEKYSDQVDGAEAVYINDNLAFGLTNGIGPEVTAMKRAGVDFVVGCLDLNGMKTVAQEMQRQGMGDVPMYHPNTYNQAFVKEAGELFEGDYVGVGFRPFEAEAGESQLDEFKKWMAETGAEIQEISMTGWINAETAYRGILEAGEDFDRQKVIDATNALEDFTAGGLIAPVDFGRAHEPPTVEDIGTRGQDLQCGVFVQVKDAKFKTIGDPAKPWTCWPGKTLEWSEPEAKSFE